MKKKVLIYYRYFGLTLGGGEYLPLRFIAALQRTCEVTLALDWTDHFERAVELMGVPIDLDRLKVEKVMPENYHATTCNPLQSIYRFRRLRRLASDADVCISLANIMDFGRSAHHFILCIDLGDEAFADHVCGTVRTSVPFLKRVRRFLEASVLRPLLGMRTRRAVIEDPGEHIYPNSLYTQSLIEGFYRVANSSVFYPPTLFEPAKVETERHPLRVVYLGRIAPAKRVDEIVTIVERARAISSKDIELHLGGHLDAGTFGRELEARVRELPWISIVGELFGDEKSRFLSSGTFAIHAMRTEAFGISITEYLKAGLVPIVPDEGGACEVVSDAELSFGSVDEAARILSRLATDHEFRESKRASCLKRAAEFSKEAYEKRERELLAAIVGE